MKLISLISLLFCLSCMEAADNAREENGKNPGGSRGEEDSKPELTVQNLKTQAFRNKGEDQITYKLMAKNRALGKTDGYRSTPNPDTDNDKEITKATSPSGVECGTSTELQSVSDRVKDCAANSAIKTPTWKALENGISGEGNFNLVLSSPTHTVWRDETTGLIWSSNLGEDKWNHASGYRLEADSEDFLCNTIKGFNDGEVSWRLPTRSDFLQADINGARFVLPETNRVYWTATSVDDSGKAWVINQSTGSIQERSFETPSSIRCVGHILK